MDFPLLVSVTSLALMVLSTWVGDALRKRAGIPEEDRRNESANLMAGAHSDPFVFPHRVHLLDGDPPLLLPDR
jgi:hypothetical protein